MAVVRGQLGDALAILGEVVRTPRFDAAELTRVKARLTDQAQDNARSNGSWGATRILFHTLYPAASPYATFGLVPSEIAKVDGAKVRDFHARMYIPSNVEIVVAGDLEMDGAAAAIEKAFGDWKGPVVAPKMEFPPPTAPDGTRVIVANRPKSVQSDVIVTGLLPERHAPNWPADRVALQVLGGGPTGRLFLDVREKRSLAYRADARYLELAHDAQPLLAYAGTQAPKTAEAVQGVLDNLATMRTAPPTDDEVATARRFLSDVFAIRKETIGAIADMVAQQRELALSDDYWDSYRAALSAVSTADVAGPSASLFVPASTLVIVAGDADVIADSLTRFGDVTIVDPEHDFRVVRTIPKSAPTSSK
jgi:predicted Zn-dependent peptidase